MNIQELLQISLEKLKETSNTPQLDAELLLGFILKKPREYVLIHPEYQLTKLQETRYKEILERRLKHEPIAYILGQKEFYGLNFKVTKDTLIPRPETEHLVDAVISNSQLVNSKKTIIVDIGTGSGNIIISLAKNINSHCHSRVCGNPVSNHKVSTLDSRFHGNDKYIFFATDISEKALSIARHNAKKNNVSNKIKFLQGNLLEPLFGNLPAGRQGWKLEIRNSKIIILANLPYLSKKIYSEAMPDVKNFEPKSALLSGTDGLDHYKKLFKQILKIQDTRYKIQTIIEISPEQKQKIAKLIKKYFPNATVEFQKDLALKWRIVIFEI